MPKRSTINAELMQFLWESPVNLNMRQTFNVRPYIFSQFLRESLYDAKSLFSVISLDNAYILYFILRRMDTVCGIICAEQNVLSEWPFSDTCNAYVTTALNEAEQCRWTFLNKTSILFSFNARNCFSSIVHEVCEVILFHVF